MYAFAHTGGWGGEGAWKFMGIDMCVCLIKNSNEEMIKKRRSIFQRVYVKTDLICKWRSHTSIDEQS